MNKQKLKDSIKRFGAASEALDFMLETLESGEENEGLLSKYGECIKGVNNLIMSFVHGTFEKYKAGITKKEKLKLIAEFQAAEKKGEKDYASMSENEYMKEKDIDLLATMTSVFKKMEKDNEYYDSFKNVIDYFMWHAQEVDKMIKGAKGKGE